jgi:hypothetical protein
LEIYSNGNLQTIIKNKFSIKNATKYVFFDVLHLHFMRVAIC